MATQVKNTFVGNGSTVFYSFTFPYIKPADVVVTINSAITTEYRFANATTLQFNTAPSNGAKIVIYRDTDDSDIEAVFFPGSAIRARDLNDNFTQSLYVIQESNSEASDASDVAEEALGIANEAKAQSQAAENKADSAISTANSANTKADSAVITANNANNNATSALSAATRAETKADAAVVTANEAKSLVDGAVGDANNAVAKADQAIATANQANTNSLTAINSASAANVTANAANTKSDAAVKTANEADENADLAIVVATNALTIADGVAQSGEPFGQLYNSSTGAAGSKVIDLGDLAPVSNTGHFPNEDQGVNKYTCSEGTGVFALGSV